MITAEAFLAVEASLTKLVQKEAATVTKAVYAKVSEALSANDYQKAREELSLLNLGPMFAKNEKALTYLTNVAMLFGASRVTQQPGTSVVGMGFEKLATQQLVGTFLQMVRQKAEAYLIKAGTDHIDELESKSLESVQKYNDKHDKLGRFARADGVGDGSPLGAGIKAGNSAYAKNAGIAYPKAEGVEVPPLGKGEIYLVRYSKEDETDTVEGVGHFAYAGKHIDDVVNSTAAYAQDTSKGYLLIGRTEDKEWKHTADEESSGQEYNGVLGTKYGAVDMVIDLSTGGVKHLTKKSNPYHDELGQFTSKDKAVWFHGTSVGGSGVPDGENLRPGRDGALWLTRDPAKAVRYAQISGENTGGEPAVFVVRDADVPQDPSNYGDDMVRATLFSPKALGLVKVGVKKANPYHDELGRFTTKEKSASGTPDAYKIYAKTVSSVAGWEKGSDYNGEVRLVPLSKIDTQPDEVWSEEYRRGSGQKTIDYLKKEAFGTVYEGGRTVGSNKLEALLVRSTDSGRYQLVDGQHRYNLLKQIGSSVAGVQVIGAVKKAERILRPFESFVDEAGKAYFNMVSSLHTSRVSAYGFTAEANVLGMQEYQINEQLDNRICPVCREMHGKTFKVSEARRLLEIVTRVSDPDDLKALQPWPKQNKDNLEKIREMTNAELVAQGWHIPPYHPGCRGLLGRVGKVPALDKVVAGQPEKYVASKDDFKTFKLPASDKQVALWNATVGLSPAEVFARMTGRTADELLSAVMDSSDPKKEAGLYSVSIAKNITIRMTKEGFGSKNPFDQGLVFKTGQKELYIDSVELSGEDQAAGVVKKYMREIYTLAKDAGATKLGLTAGLDVGGYAWAKYGFKPTIQAWETLKKDLYAKSAKLGYQTLLPEEKSKLLNVLLSSDDPASIFTLSDTVGKELLMGSMWEGALNFTDAESVARFLGYIGELK